MSSAAGKAEFLVIGGGSAGCIMAARLAEAGHKTVLVEAGPPDLHPLIHVPAGVRYLHGNPALTWADAAETGPAAGNRTIPWPHGRVMGGSGSINGMIFARGAAADYDRWAQMGCTGWDYDSVARSFARMEHYRGAPNRPGRGYDGPLSVEDPRLRLPVTELFLRAAEAAGHRRLEDLNSGDPYGAGLTQMNRFGRFRGSSARAFLNRGRRSGKLTVLSRTLVRKLVFEGTRCVGAICVQNGKPLDLKAMREVIVCAGAMNSPALLMRSGIGDAQALETLGIGPVADRAEVGRNLQDHFAVRLSYRLRGVTTINDLARPPRLWGEVLRWLTSGRGVLTTGVTAAQVYVKSNPDLVSPDLCLLFSPSSFDRDRFGALEREPGCLITVSICSPESRGRLSLRDADPETPPVIEAGYFSAPSDVPVMLNGIEAARNIMEQSPIREAIVEETLPGPDPLEDYIRNNCHTMYHASGTCRMGSDPEAVVDPRLRVNGIDGLRVADASIMPRISSGNTNAPTMMIAEHGSRLILGEYGGRTAEA